VAQDLVELLGAEIFSTICAVACKLYRIFLVGNTACNPWSQARRLSSIEYDVTYGMRRLHSCITLPWNFCYDPKKVLQYLGRV
jgi:hypothetical protein